MAFSRQNTQRQRSIRMSKAACFIIPLFIGLWLGSPQAGEAFQNEPTGFRGLTWETPFEAVQGLRLVDERQVNGQRISVYTRESDQLVFGGTKIDRIRYVFLQGRFFLVHVVATDSRSKYKTIRKTLYDRFGQPSAAFPRRDRYYWEGEEVTVSLEYDDFPGRSVVSYYYKPIGSSIAPNE
jgi:hypothetical protein